MRVSPLSVFEVSALHGWGRLRLSRSLEQWLDAASDGAGIRLAPLSREASVEAGLLSRGCDSRIRWIDCSWRLRTSRKPRLSRADRRILDYAASSRALRARTTPSR